MYQKSLHGYTGPWAWRSLLKILALNIHFLIIFLHRLKETKGKVLPCSVLNLRCMSPKTIHAYTAPWALRSTLKILLYILIFIAFFCTGLGIAECMVLPYSVLNLRCMYQKSLHFYTGPWARTSPFQIFALYINFFVIFLQGPKETEGKVLPYFVLNQRCMSPKTLHAYTAPWALRSTFKILLYIYIHFYSFFLHRTWKAELSRFILF